MIEERIQRTIRRVLVAARGEPAATLVELLEGHGIETVAVFDAVDADAPHLDTASWAVPLPVHPPERYASILCDQALDAGADAVLPGPVDAAGGDTLAVDSDAARTVAACGLAWIGPGATWIARLPETTAHGDDTADCVEVALLGDGTHVAAWADAHVGASWTTCPSGLDAHARGALLARASTWAAESGLSGPAVARFVVDGTGRPRAERLVPGLPRWHALVALDDRPLALAAVQILAGHDLPSPSDGPPAAWALEVRLRAVTAGMLEDVETPDGIRATLGAAPGQEVAPGDVLCVLRLEGSDAPAVRRAAREALAATGIHGVATDAEALRAALASTAAGLC
jgi:acetyl/propionyl-CoA carboxylase alpha subunit